jgi:hypothetical protein
LYLYFFSKKKKQNKKTRISSNPSTDLGIAVMIVRIHVKERAVASIGVMPRTVSRLT